MQIDEYLYTPQTKTKTKVLTTMSSRGLTTMSSRGFSFLRRGFLFVSAFYVLQVVLLLNLDPCVTKNSILPSRLSCNNAEHESNAVIQRANTITTPTTASDKIELQVALPVTYDLGTDLGVPQIYHFADSAAIRDRIGRARIYINDVVAVNITYSDKVRDLCKNLSERCAFYAVKGQCDVFPRLKIECAPVCESCEYMDFDLRCKVDPDAVDALYPGDLDRIYESITTNPAFEKYGLKVLSRPSYAPGDTAETTDYQLGPWIVVFDNAVTDEEADRFIELGSKLGYTKSTTNVVGKHENDGTLTTLEIAGRTSTTAWCFFECAEDPTVQRVMNRIAAITGIAETNYEHVQILKYEKGQFYRTHNDYIGDQKTRQPGVRILTFYFYLSDVDEGGGTNFPNLNLTVAPKKGRAVLWPSVLNDDPNSEDTRTNHEALAVVRGVKYGFNSWIHQRDFKGAVERGCQ
jgi:prolyl 4-hydroxylase